LVNGFDGYCYALRNADVNKNYETYNCYKVIDGDFQKMPKY